MVAPRMVYKLHLICISSLFWYKEDAGLWKKKRTLIGALCLCLYGADIVLFLCNDFWIKNNLSIELLLPDT